MLFEKIGVIDENFDYQSDMYVLTQGDRITYVGKTRPDGEFTDIYDGKNKALLPGFVNAHTHSTMTLLRGYAENLPLERWLNEKVFPFEDTLTPEMVYDASVNGIKEMLSTGTTCFNDMYFFQEETARAAKELGMRGVLNEGITDSVLENKIKKTEKCINCTWLQLMHFLL